MRFCSYCGKPIPQVEAVFCGYCGKNAPLDSETIECPKCKNRLPVGGHFCSFCGLSLAAQTPTLNDATPSATSQVSAPAVQRQSALFQTKEKSAYSWKPLAYVLGCFMVLVIFIVSVSRTTQDESSSKSRPQFRPSATNPEASPKSSAAPQVTAPRPSASGSVHRTIGISYDSFMKYLSNIFVMTKTDVLKAGDRYMGMTGDKLASLEVIGDKQNISEACLVVGLPSDSDSVLARNGGLILRFVANCDPDWEDAVTWATDTVGRLVSSGDSSVEQITRGDKLIEMRWIKPQRMVFLSVRHRDQK